MNGQISLDGKVALVTGSSRGLGWAIARSLAGAGAHVVLNGRNEDTLRARADELTAVGCAASLAPFDVATGAADGIGRVVTAHGRLDILVCNAGINVRKAFADFTAADWQGVIDTNLTACFTLAQGAAPTMVAQGGGRIIMTGSIMGRVARPGLPAYIAAKGGIDALTRALAVELGPAGITCNAIAPGYIATEMTAKLTADEEFDAMVKRRTPLGRWGEPEEIGAVALFLASDAASYVNGHVLVVDGGMTAAL